MNIDIWVRGNYLGLGRYKIVCMKGRGEISKMDDFVKGKNVLKE